MGYKLLASDIDGTLFDSRCVLPKSTIASVGAMLERGFYFVLASGRPLQGIKALSERMGLEHMPTIVYNGARAVYEGETLFSAELPDESAREICKIGREMGTTLLLWSEDVLYAETLSEKTERYSQIVCTEPRLAADASQIKKVTKIVWYDDPETTARRYPIMKERLGGEVNVHPSRAEFLEFVGKSASKGASLAAIIKRLGLRAEETIAVGDGYNDVSMLRAAGLGAAVANAPDEVKCAADLVVPSVYENGVNELIDRFFLK